MGSASILSRLLTTLLVRVLGLGLGLGLAGGAQKGLWDTVGVVGPGVDDAGVRDVGALLTRGLLAVLRLQNVQHLARVCSWRDAKRDGWRVWLTAARVGEKQH